MAKQLQIRGGTTVQHSTFTGALREITIDTDKDVVVVHDGTTVGGFPLAKQTSVDSKVTKVTSTDNAIVRFNGTTGDVQNSGVVIDDNNNISKTVPTGNGNMLLDTGSTGVSNYIRFKNTVDNDTSYIYNIGSELRVVQSSTNSNSILTFGTQNIERMRIDSSGNVGIGVTPSAWGSIKAIDLGGAGAISSSGTMSVSENSYYNGTNWFYKNSATATLFQQPEGTGSYIWYTAPSGTAGNAIPFTNVMTLDNNGSLLLTSGTGGLGYGTGAGGTVTQLTSKSTDVVLNKPTGKVITSNAALAAGASVSFLLNNSLITTTDTVNVTIIGTGIGQHYRVRAFTGGAGGACAIYIENVTASSYSEAITIQFNIQKGANA